MLSIELLSSIIIVFTGFQCFGYADFEFGFGQDNRSVSDLAHRFFGKTEAGFTPDGAEDTSEPQ